MKKIKIKKGILFFLLFSYINILGQTIIENNSEVSGEWTKENSPYIIKGTVIVPYEQTLVIQEGVVVKFKSGHKFTRYNEQNLNPDFDAGCMIVYGNLLVRGTYQMPVTFTSDSVNGKWAGIIFYKSKYNQIENAIFENTAYIRNFEPDLDATGALTFIKSKGYIYNCVFTNAWSAVNAKRNSKIQIINSVLTKSKYGLEVATGARVNLVNTIIWNNENGFYYTNNVDIISDHCLIQEKPPIIFDRRGTIVGKDPLLTPTYRVNPNSPAFKTGKFKRNIGLDNLL